MLIPVNQFFSTLPEKHCQECGLSMEEMADCYQTVCDRCDDVLFYNVRDHAITE